MIISIDGYEANEAHRVGIGEYAYQILFHIHRLLHERVDIKARIYLPNAPLTHMPEETSYWQYRVKKPRKLWTFGALPLNLMTDLPHPDVVFSPTHYVPRFIPFPRVMSIMDLSFLSYPELFKKKDYYQLLNWTEYSVKHAAAIFTISEFTRNAILKQYKVRPEAVFVTYPGITPIKHMDIKKSDLQEKYTIGSRFILSVGTIQPRKNYERLIEAFSLLKEKGDADDLQLVIIGKKGWLFESILEAPRRYNVSDSVRFLDYVPDEDLPSFYSQAECFVLASLYEGFGLPVLEAMANKCIVVTSKISSLPEIAGDAGIYVEPEKHESILAGIQQALQEKGTEKGNNRVTLGLNRVKIFSWESAAKQTLDVLEKVAHHTL